MPTRSFKPTIDGVVSDVLTRRLIFILCHFPGRGISWAKGLERRSWYARHRRIVWTEWYLGVAVL